MSAIGVDGGEASNSPDTQKWVWRSSKQLFLEAVSFFFVCGSVYDHVGPALSRGWGR